MINLLLENDADLKLKNTYGETALRTAISHHTPSLKIIERLIKAKSDINSSDTDKTSILHAAVKTGNIDIVKLVLDFEPDRSLKNKYKETAYELALDKKLTKIADLLKSN